MRAAYRSLRAAVAVVGAALLACAACPQPHTGLAVAWVLLLVGVVLVAPLLTLRRAVDALDGPRRDDAVVLRDLGGDAPDCELDARTFWHLAVSGVFLPAGIFAAERTRFHVDGRYRPLVPEGAFSAERLAVTDPIVAHACGWAAATLISARLDGMRADHAWVDDFSRDQNAAVSRAARFLTACRGFEVIACAPPAPSLPDAPTETR